MLTRAPEVRLKQKQKTSRNNGQNSPKLDENTSLHTEVQLIPRINTKKTKPKYIKSNYLNSNILIFKRKF